MLGLIDTCKVSRVSNAVAAGSSDSNGSSVDMSGFNSVLFIASLGTLTSSTVCGIKVQGSTDDSTFVDLEGTAKTIADTDDNCLLQVEVVKPTYRYLRPVITRATANAVIDSVIAIQANAGVLKPTQAATTLGNEQHVSPGAGTA